VEIVKAFNNLENFWAVDFDSLSAARLHLCSPERVSVRPSFIHRCPSGCQESGA